MRIILMIFSLLLIGCQTTDEAISNPSDVRHVKLQWKERGEFNTVVDLGVTQPRMWLTNDISCDYSYYYVEVGFKGRWSLKCSDGENIEGGFVTLEEWEEGIVGVGSDKMDNQVIITISPRTELTLPS